MSLQTQSLRLAGEIVGRWNVGEHEVYIIQAGVQFYCYNNKLLTYLELIPIGLVWLC